MASKIISVLNQKGGVGKTTTSLNFAAALAYFQKKVLLIDFDPQGALSIAIGADAVKSLTIYDCLIDGKDPVKAIQKTNIKNLDIISANIDLSAAELQLVTEVAREFALKRALDKVSDIYDYIIIDCQPSLGLLAVNALTSSDGVLIPLQAEYFALRAVALLNETVNKIKDRLNANLKIYGLLITFYDARTLHGKEVKDATEKQWKDLVFKTYIPKTIKFADASVSHKSILDYAPSSAAATAYLGLAKEFLKKYDK